MILIPFSQKPAHPGVTRTTDPKTGEPMEPCIVCNRDLQSSAVRYRLHLWIGSYAITQAEADKMHAADPKHYASGDMGWYAVGPDCLRRCPELKPYVEKT